MKNYELTYLISPDISEDQSKTLSFEIADFIAKEQGAVKGKTEPVRKKIAYPVKKKNNAFLSVLSFHFSPEKLKNLEKQLKEEKRILRYMIVNKKEEKITKKRIKEFIIKPSKEKKTPKIIEERKTKLKEIDKKIEEILRE